jgi:arabinogalactan oligomer/maltooligosaccharide transport system permease protein
MRPTGLAKTSALLFVGALCLASVLPILFVVSVSFSKGGELYAGRLLPEGLTLDNYRALFTTTDFLLWVKNSLVVASSTAFSAVVIASLSSFALARRRFFASDLIGTGILVVQFFPGVMSLVAIYKILQFLKILDTHAALVLVYLGGAVPFATWMLKGYYETTPRSLEEAATLDGAGPLGVYLFVVLPTSAPVLLVAFSLAFIAAYSDFLLAAVVLTDERLYTLALGLRTFLEGDFSTNWSIFSAAALVGSLPIIVMFLIVAAAIRMGRLSAPEGPRA